MPETSVIPARRGRGRPPQARPARVVVPKVKRTISLAQCLDQEIFERAQRDGTSYSGVVEETMRRALGDQVAV